VVSTLAAVRGLLPLVNAFWPARWLKVYQRLSLVEFVGNFGGHHVATYTFSQPADRLYAILVALSMFSRGQATVETVAALLQNPQWYSSSA
jgi:hypothetical protein